MYAYYILHTLHRFPSEWMGLPRAEQAAIFAMVDERIKQSKSEAARAKRLQAQGARR